MATYCWSRVYYSAKLLLWGNKEMVLHGVNETLSLAVKKSKEKEKSGPAEKRTFIFLLLLTCLVLIVLAVVLWLIPYIGFSNIHPRLPLIMAVLFASIVLFLIGGGLTLIFTILRGKNLFFNRRIRGVVIRFLFPLLVVIGKCVGVSKKRVRRAFVAVNNQLVLAEARIVRPEKLLILLPHCIQFHECDVMLCPPELSRFGVFDTKNHNEIFEIGYQAARSRLGEIERALDARA